ncbi:hypothetical protein [Aurantiacibacter marinus]|uniref:Uncharacterized protein n=1 Tax=Aurantiacibacter marinus TaxID=874156 RepID=A0A0H0XSM5_9SPHN|nr:hypothetical protein [Aurantiacibacter marinus]KLI64947.1 hypothetical protein AAV99_05505 [Aurantiacibacter marinus]
MIGKIIGAGVGAALSKQTRSIGGTTGAVLGTVAVPIISRMSLPAMLAIAAGGYVVKKFADKGRTGAPRANV